MEEVITMRSSHAGSRRLLITLTAFFFALTLGAGTAHAQPTWWARTGEAVYDPTTQNVRLRITYSCPQVERRGGTTPAAQMEIRQGQTYRKGLLDTFINCPANQAPETVYSGIGQAFDRDRPAEVRVSIGFARNIAIIGPVPDFRFFPQYTSEWRTVCLYGGNAELCPQ
ncbi:hypothetical protein ACTWP5_17820 [Streptomyces sp. 4N509B]|uniref:hypothetical protein n=1 Tax=Streptomyces sp. 4N509B TaxID=3457413 RepID=UPI003FD6B898